MQLQQFHQKQQNKSSKLNTKKLDGMSHILALSFLSKEHQFDQYHISTTNLSENHQSNQYIISKLKVNSFASNFQNP
jgi:hypothetical protein